MDSQESKDDIKDRIKEITDRMALNASSSSANAQRLVASSLGAETPVGILCDIRDSQNRLLESTKDLIHAMQEKEFKDEARHKELCTILLALGSGQAGPSRSILGSNSVVDSKPTFASKHSYYGPVALTSGAHLVSCVMMHIDILLKKHTRFKPIQNTDMTFMDIKEWYVLTSAVLNSDKNAKAGLRIPKPSDEDFKSAARIISSVEGRRPNCDPSHIAALLEHSAALMNTVDWVVKALIKCTGSLSPERHCRFRETSYPFVDSDLCMLVKKGVKLSMPKRDPHVSFQELKVTEKKEYMSLILEKDYSPTDAMARVKKQ